MNDLINIGEYWEMFTNAGNKSITKKFELLVKRLEKAKTQSQKLRAVELFISSFYKMSKSKTMREAGDTAVRERVAIFLREICANYDVCMRVNL